MFHSLLNLELEMRKGKAARFKLGQYIFADIAYTSCEKSSKFS